MTCKQAVLLERDDKKIEQQTIKKVLEILENKEQTYKRLLELTKPEKEMRHYKAAWLDLNNAIDQIKKEFNVKE